MSNILNMFKPKKTTEETQQIMQVKQDYYNNLSNTNTKIKTSLDKNEILPETGNYLYKLVIKAQTWLKNNPDASVSDIQTNNLDLNTEVKRIYDTEGNIVQHGRWGILLWVATFAVSAKDLLKQKVITEEQNKTIQDILKTTVQWYIKNKYTATQPEFQQQTEIITSDIVTLLTTNNDAIKYIDNTFRSMGNLTRKQLNDTLLENNIVVTDLSDKQKKQLSTVLADKEKQEKENEPVDPSEVIQSTAWSTFFKILGYLMGILGGSFAANMAIGRPNMYRVLYFIYGYMPYFAPFVILYTIYKRIRYGPVPLYAILPLSVEPATTRLGKLLWYPFFWIKDGLALAEETKYLESLKLP